MKFCNKCGELKSKFEFSIARKNPDGRRNICKACDAISAKNVKSKKLEKTSVYLSHASRIKYRVYSELIKIIAGEERIVKSELEEFHSKDDALEYHKKLTEQFGSAEIKEIKYNPDLIF